MNKVFKTYNVFKLNRGCEVGVRHAIFSEYLLRNNKNLYMTLVDPYEAYNDLGYEFTKEEQESILEGALILLEKYDTRAFWRLMSSYEAAPCFEDFWFDFVFIDGEHTYSSVKQDLRTWYPKVRTGGLLCGHDNSMVQVAQAVTDFKIEKGVKEVFSSPSDQGDCFWMVKE
jgi:hypothetical protein